jgi:hypothetical protein
VRGHAGELDLVADGLDGQVVQGVLVGAVGAAPDVVVEGKGVHGDEVAGEHALQRGGERERVAAALAAVDADDDGLEHGVLLTRWWLSAHAVTCSRAWEASTCA